MYNSCFFAGFIFFKSLVERYGYGMIPSDKQIEIAMFHHFKGLLLNSCKAFLPAPRHIHISEIIYKIFGKHMPVISCTWHIKLCKLAYSGRSLRCSRLLRSAAVKRYAQHRNCSLSRFFCRNIKPFIHLHCLLCSRRGRSPQRPLPQVSVCTCGRLLFWFQPYS